MSRVVIVSEFFPPQTGGIQRSLALMLPALGDSIEVISPAPTTLPGLRRSLFSGRLWPRWTWLLVELWRQHRRGPTFFLFGHYSAAVTAARLLHPFGLRYAVLIHGQDILSELQRRTRGLVRANLMQAEWIGINSHWLQRHLEILRIPQHKFILTHPAVSDDEGQENNPHRHSHWLLSISRLVPRKNIQAILESLPSLKVKFSDIHYHIIGDGPDRQKLEKIAGELQIKDCVTFHGQVDDKERERLLSQSGIFVLAPIVREKGSDIEGLGAVYLEAGAWSLPTVASATGGISDAVIDRKTGRLLTTPDAENLSTALTELLQQPEQAVRYGQNAFQHINHEFRATIRNRRVQAALPGNNLTQMPVISVVIPAYQTATAIGQTLQSLFQQTLLPKEIIVINDGSTDNLEEVLAPWRDKIIYRRQANAGAPTARNNGAALANGEFLLFLDSDITMKPGMLEEMARALVAHPEAGYVYSDYYFGWKSFHLFDFSSKRLEENNYIHTSSLMRRQLFPGFDPSLKRLQDWDLWLTLKQKGIQGLWIPKNLFTVQQRGGTISSWVPSFVYKVPFIGQGKGSANIARYRQAEQIVRKKHGLS